MDMKMRENYVMVEDTSGVFESVTDAGLVVIHSQKAEDAPKALSAKVLAVGPDVRDVKVGDTAVFEYFAGAAYRDRIILREDVVLATMPESE